MKYAQANTKQTTYQPNGGILQIYWDEQEKQREIMDEMETYYQYRFCQVRVTANRAQIIEAIMATEYTTGAEFAAINNGGADYEAYQAFRATAKALADGWLNYAD